MRIMSLDLAIRTGWAVGGFTGPGEVTFTESGVQEFTLPRGASAGVRWMDFRVWLTWAIDRWKPELIAYEKPIAWAANRGQGAAAEIAFGMSTRVQEIAEAVGIDYRPVNLSTLKLWATGKGNAGKPEMIAAACRVWAREITDDNEADALLLLAYAQAGFPQQEAKPKRRKARP